MTSSGLAALAAVSLLAAAQAGQVPTVKSGVEVIAVDVEVVGRDGEPIAGRSTMIPIGSAASPLMATSGSGSGAEANPDGSVWTVSPSAL